MLIKICGMRREDDLRHAASLGVNFCGFIFHAGSPRYIPPDRAGALPSYGMNRIGVFVESNPERIIESMNQAKADMAQLHGNQDIDCAMRIGRENVIRVIWPEKYGSIPDVQAAINYFANSCSYYLLDAGKSGGGHGKSFNWKMLAGLRFPHPWLLAGGLDVANAGQALEQCEPDGLDFNSTLEDSPGIKNHEKMRAAIAAVRNYRGNML